MGEAGLMAGDGKVNGSDVLREDEMLGEDVFDGRGWQGECQGCLEGGCSGKGWQGKC